ncbi:glycoside hydrolase family 113 [Pseudozobellia thermophila]|uniref:GTA TIM-barrel-like domain-containing protein n=1 Tax=Pseudozobellia thermophila TaxID=192903 RepID=A0A1M6D245_9FLAO|nr:glycoside hydrolase TIM-barrel-like domain-containing protein [Pseudozobellia thermophila]SHI67269.1 GTA TIM-barrel-like domain-containing protein [Pseudozobellia thermophila]
MKWIGLCLLILLQYSCNSQVQEKINGVSFVASRKAVAQEHVQEVKNIHANHAAVMPFGFVRDPEVPEIIFDTERQWHGETSKGAKQYIELLHQNGIRVMLKPQIWIWKGIFTGSLAMKSEEDWKRLETSYEKFILNYAELANETRVDIFCIGTELGKFVNARPDFWQGLIAKVRDVYQGKLTYAANWDEYTRSPFWKELDYIGIDAYFPLCEHQTPTVEQCREGWKKHKPHIEELSRKNNRPVLFTEFGYRSTDQTAWKPWLVDRHDKPVNLLGQRNATQAIFEEFWGEDWFAGGYVWKWFIDHKESGGAQDNRFTPQNKPAQEVIKDFYSKY